MPQFMGSQITGHNLATEQQFTKQVVFKIHSSLRIKECVQFLSLVLAFFSQRISKSKLPQK